MVEAEFILGGLEAVLDGPAMPFHTDQGFDSRAGRTPGGEAGKVITGDVAADQHASGPYPGCAIDVFVGFEVSEFETGLVMDALALGALAHRQALPRSSIEVICDLRGGARDDRLVAPRAAAMVALYAQQIALAGTAQHLLDVADAVDRIRREPSRKAYWPRSTAPASKRNARSSAEKGAADPGDRSLARRMDDQGLRAHRRHRPCLCADADRRQCQRRESGARASRTCWPNALPHR
ncbi:hypothetical protein QE360_003492 [Sphingomonas sp. SORGH_AS789]|nr:hypothetical protein [Sphingomonas sp. SORGH_AS_0789]MDR6149802.1 hypothetical protein [Sphingomonas sp. SORGH_AS_0742]